MEVHGISGVISKVTILLTPIGGLITPLITTHEPPSSDRNYTGTAMVQDVRTRVSRRESSLKVNERAGLNSACLAASVQTTVENRVTSSRAGSC